jgi:hypothetical protein
MKKIILEEIENMKYLLGYKRGVVISEQTTPVVAQDDDNILDPKVTDAIKQAQNMVGGQSVLPNATTGAPTTGAPAATTQAAPATPIKIGVKYPSIMELQNSLNTKFQSGLTPDGKYGPKTSESILAALQKVQTNTDPSKAATETAKVAQTGNLPSTGTGTPATGTGVPTAGTTPGATSGVIAVNANDIIATS